MKRLLFALGASAVLAAPAAAQIKDTVVKLDAIAAMVGSTPITVYDIERRLSDSISFFLQRSAGMPSRTLQLEMARSALNDLVDEEVLLIKAKEANIEITDVELQEAVETTIKDNSSRFPSQSAFRQALLEAGYGSPEEYRRSLSAQYRRIQTIQRF